MENQEERDDGFQSLLEIISRRKGLIILGFITVFIVSFLGAFFLPPVYETYTTILVQPEEIDLQRDYVSPFSKDEFIGNQRELIKSRNILLEVIKTLRLDKETSNPSFSEKIIYKFFQTNPDPIEEAIRKLIRKISIEGTGARDIFRITVKDDDPFEAALLADTLAKIYSEYVNSSRLGKARSNYDFIAEQVVIAKKKLTDSEEALREFKLKENLVTIKEEKDNIMYGLSTAEVQSREITSKVQELENEISQAKSYLETSEWRLPEYDSNDIKLEEILSSSLFFNNIEIKGIITKIKELEAELLSNKARYSENYIKKNPQLSNQHEKLNEKLNEKKIELYEIMNNILNNSEIQLDALRNKKQYLDNIIQAENFRLRKIPQKEFELNSLRRAIRTNEEIYLMFLKKLEGTRISEVTEKWAMGGVKVLDRAFPPTYPLRRKKAMLIALGFMMGIVFGIGMAFFAEFKDRSLKTPHEIEKISKLSVLGTVPLTSRKNRKYFLGFKHN